MNFRRLEEIALNASGPLNPRLFDGWMLGFTPGRSKRGRSINPFFKSTLPIEAKVEACREMYAAAGLPCIVRLTPFAQPPELDQWLIEQGYERFGDTLVMARSLEDWKPDKGATTGSPRCVALDLSEWNAETQSVRSLSADQVRRVLDRQDLLHLDGCGMLMRANGAPIAWGMTLVEEGWAGLYNLETRADDDRRDGLARRLVSALVSWSQRHGAGAAYLQVNEHDTAAIPLYE